MRRRLLSAAACALFLGGNVAFGQSIAVKIGKPTGISAPPPIPVPAQIEARPAVVQAVASSPESEGGSIRSLFPVVSWVSQPAGPVTPTAPMAQAPMPVSGEPVVMRADTACESWTGFYLGVNMGGAIGSGTTHDSAFFGSATTGPNGLLDGSGHDSGTSWIAGGQVGYDRQVLGLVVGIEADWQYVNQRSTTTEGTPPATLPFFGAGGNGFGYALDDTHKLQDVGTLRLRGGFLVADTLIYATGGLAWGTATDTLNFRGSANNVIFASPLDNGPFLASSARFSDRKVGYALGGGLETRLSRHWSVKAEYVFVGLGRINHNMPIAINPIFGPAFTTGNAVGISNWLANDNIARVGLNYRF